MAERVAAPTGRPFAIALAASTALVVATAALAGGCTARNCDGDVLTYGRSPGEGSLADPNTWQSTPFDGRWLDFPHRRQWILDTSALGSRTPKAVYGYVSAFPEPNKVPSPGERTGNFTLAGGDLLLFVLVKPGQLSVLNSTCADFYLRVVVEAVPEPPDTDPDVDGEDAGSDSGSDGGDDGGDDAGPDGGDAEP